jgi:hypothetical protein
MKRKPSAWAALTLAFFLLLTGCNSTRLTTNQAEDARKSFTRAYVIINEYNESRFYRTLVRELKTGLAENSVQNEMLLLDILSLTPPEEISAAIDEFNPEVVVEFTELRKTSFFIPDIYTPIHDGRVCLVEVKEFSTNRTLWKGKLVTDEFLASRIAARKSVRKILESFTQGELISLRSGPE